MSYPDEQKKDGGFAINQFSGQFTQTGQLDRRTLLHKRYHIQRVIGRGGMGAVYQAKDLKRQTICAIKEMSISMVPPEDRVQAIENFKIEAHMLWGLNHPNLPAFHGFFKENQRYYLVMEFVDGFTLEELLERNGAPFSERRVLGWARQLCDVLSYLHEQDPPIIFRDMKPGNIMLTRNGRIKLIDFGIARFFRSSTAHDTQLLGTPGFAPPEQYGKAQTDIRSDIYSLSITLFQLLTNTLSENGFGLKDIRLINPEISPVVARALEKAASLEASERYSSVEEFRRALFGLGTFVFESGQQASTAEELAELCMQYLDEAADYLMDGEIELWLQEINENDLAAVVRHLRTTRAYDPSGNVEQFLDAVLGPQAHSTSKKRTRTPSKAGVATKIRPSWLIRQSGSPVLVSPHTLDFGTVHPGISAPLTIAIQSSHGSMLRGTVHTYEPWIMLDQVKFEGHDNTINVRINSTRLHGPAHYTGTVVIVTDNPDDHETIITVSADTIANYQPPSLSLDERRRKTHVPDLNEDDDYDEDDEDELTVGNITAVHEIVGNQAMSAPLHTSNIGRSKHKYGRRDIGWDPIVISLQHRRWLQRVRTFVMALMAASVVYTLVASLPPLKDMPPLLPNPWYALVLAGLAPAASLGALLSRPESLSRGTNVLDWLSVTMTASLATLALGKLLWRLLVQQQFPQMGLVTMLLVATLTATFCAHSDFFHYRLPAIADWLMVRSRALALYLFIVIGALLGILLAIDVPFLGVFSLTSIGVGMAVTGLFIWRIDQRRRRRRSRQQPTTNP